MIDEKKLIEKLSYLREEERDNALKFLHMEDADLHAKYTHGEYCYCNAINIINNQPKVDILDTNIGMTINEYQTLASRTIDSKLAPFSIEYHALHGMVGEVGELHSIYQKKYQGHEIDEEHQKKELGDLLWFIAEYCTSKGWSLEEVAQMNIDKLKARYPDGFDAKKSLHRAVGDV